MKHIFTIAVNAGGVEISYRKKGGKAEWLNGKALEKAQYIADELVKKLDDLSKESGGNRV